MILKIIPGKKGKEDGSTQDTNLPAASNAISIEKKQKQEVSK